MSKLRCYTYRLPLTEPLMVGSRTIDHREGLLVSIQVADQLRWGDAAPLPGFSRESFADILDAARQQDWTRYPSLSAAYHALDLPAGPVQVPVSRLLLGSVDAIRHQLDAVGHWPHAAIKLKVGRPGQLAAEIALVHELRATMRPEQTLRLDANRAWSFDEALAFATATCALAIEYVEEPTAQPADFERIYRATGLRYALDESLRDSTVLERLPHAAALIIKPTLMGWPPANLARLPTHIPWVFSASFECGLGLLQVARLASQWADGTPAGLDTYRWLATDVLNPRLTFADGYLSLLEQPSVDMRMLQEFTP